LCAKRLNFKNNGPNTLFPLWRYLRVSNILIYRNETFQSRFALSQLKDYRQPAILYRVKFQLRRVARLRRLEKSAGVPQLQNT